MKLSLMDQYIPPGRGKGLLNGLLGSVGDAAKEVRGISHNLAPLSLQHQELTKALEELVYQIELTDANLDIELHYAPDINTSLSAIVKQNIYQTAKELFNNILKYASASQIRVRLHRDQDHYQLEMVDNGMTYDPERAMVESGGM
jgi:signal transduction histidine kinase